MAKRTELSIVGGKWLSVVNDTSEFDCEREFLCRISDVTGAFRTRNAEYTMRLVVAGFSRSALIVGWETAELVRFLADAEFATAVESAIAR